VKENETFPYRYFVVTFLWTWIFWLPLALAGLGILPLGAALVRNLLAPATFLGGAGPAIGAFYSLRTLSGKGSVANYLKGVLDLRFGWKAWIIPVIVLGGIAFIAWGLPELWGEPRLATLLPSLWVFPLYLLYMIFVGGGLEELGWRGYIMDRMEDRLGPWLGNLVLGVTWAVWHLPLFFIPGTSQGYMNFWGFMLMATGNSWFFAWVRRSSGNRTAAGIMAHGLLNAFAGVFPFIVTIQNRSQPRFWIFASLAFVAGLITMIIRSITKSDSRPAAVQA
jgi:uncharacterized protein